MVNKHRSHPTDPRSKQEGEIEAREATQQAGGAANDSEAPADLEGPQSEIEALRKERDEFQAHWQRAQADYQNLRRRLQSDIDAAVVRSKRPLLQDLLLVLDYLEMALRSPCTTEEGKGLLAGVEMTKSVLMRALEREKVQAVPEGGSFDAALHEAVERVETNEREPGEVIETLRRGYSSEGQILRPAQVKVAVLPLLPKHASTSATDED